MKIKMYCIFAKESVQKMNGIRGKMCTQAGHAYLHAFWDAFSDSPTIHFAADESIFKEDSNKIAYRKHKQAVDYKNSERAYKITLIVDTVEELVALQEKYKDICGTSLVTDAGFTVFNEPTTTCLGIGPLSEDMIGDDLKAIKTFC